MTNDKEHSLLDRLRWVSEWYFVDPVDGKAYASDDPLDAADRIEELEARYEKSQDQIDRLIAENERLRNAGDGDVGLIHWQGERIEQLEAALTKSEALQDLAYYNGAKQYAAISAQSEDAARDWLNSGCGNRQHDAIAALGDAK